MTGIQRLALEAAGAACIALAWAAPAAARDLLVGQGQAFTAPSDAVRAAQAGDRVLIDPGEYYDCAAWSTPGLTLEGRGPGVVLTDRTCQDKAILVVGGPGAILRGLTLARARVGDGNGAGVRLEAPGLLLDRVTFRNDQVGLLSGVQGGAITVTDCRFEGVGTAGDRPLPAILAGGADLLLVRGSTFADGRGGAVSSDARETVMEGNTVANPGVLPAVVAGGRLTLTGNSFSIGADAAGRPGMALGAVLATGPDAPVLRGNRLASARPAALLLDWSGGTPVLDGNQVGAADQESSTAGAWRRRASDMAHGAKDGLRGLAGRAKRMVLGH